MEQKNPCAESTAILVPMMGCARATDETEESNVIPTILLGLTSSHPACSKQVLKSFHPFCQHANHEFIQTVLRTMFLKVIWYDSLSDCIGRKFLTEQIGCVPDNLEEENFICRFRSVYGE